MESLRHEAGRRDGTARTTVDRMMHIRTTVIPGRVGVVMGRRDLGCHVEGEDSWIGCDASGHVERGLVKLTIIVWQVVGWIGLLGAPQDICVASIRLGHGILPVLVRGLMVRKELVILSVEALLMVPDGTALLLHGEERLREGPGGCEGGECWMLMMVEVGVVEGNAFSIEAGVVGVEGEGKVVLVVHGGEYQEKVERIGCGSND